MEFKKSSKTKMGFVQSLPVVNLWKYRSLLFHFSLMNIKARYKGTYLGFVWAALEPTLFFIVLYLVFTGLRIGRGENFGIYLLTGFILFHVFTRGSTHGISSLQEGSNILLSLKIRKEFFPVLNTTTIFLVMLIEIGVLFGLMPFFNFIPPWTIVALPVLVAILLFLVLGLSYLLSIVFVYLRDIQPFWVVFAHGLFFLTPIFWYVKDAQGFLLWAYSINPIGQIVEIGHKLVVDGEIPAIQEWAYAFFISLIIFAIGYTVFLKFQDRVLEEL